MLTGKFTVKMRTPASLGDFAHLTFDKTFEGELSGTSVVQMLSAGDPKTGNAAYVAMEKFTGTVQGRTGSFCMQQTGVMDGGKPSLQIAVVPGASTGELVSLKGTLTIEVTQGQHWYHADFTL